LRFGSPSPLHTKLYRVLNPAEHHDRLRGWTIYPSALFLETNLIATYPHASLCCWPMPPRSKALTTDCPLSAAETPDRHGHTKTATRACLSTWSNLRQHAMWCRPLPTTRACHMLLFQNISRTLNRRGTLFGGYLVVVANRGLPSRHLIEVVRLSTVDVSCKGRHPFHVIPRRQSRAFVMIEQSRNKRKEQPKQ
jgi:hypothetical protein